ncbi:MAG: FtsX-like permease family protein [Christensenellaceae bacterium]|jgi:ABC-type antimicrobial peptide transport system permease subunit
MQKIIASNPYSDIFILRDQLEQDQRFMDTINRAFFITFSIVGGLVLTSFLSILSLSLQQRSHSYAIMRALGMKKRQIFISILLELLIYVGFCVVIIGILGIFSGIFTLKKVLATVPSLLMLSPVFIAIFLASLFIFLFSTIIAWQFTRKIYQSSVHSVMRKSVSL